MTTYQKCTVFGPTGLSHANGFSFAFSFFSVSFAASAVASPGIVDSHRFENVWRKVVRNGANALTGRNPARKDMSMCFLVWIGIRGSGDRANWGEGGSHKWWWNARAGLNPELISLSRLGGVDDLQRLTSRERQNKRQLKRQLDNMATKYAFGKGLKELRFTLCQTSEQSAALRSEIGLQWRWRKLLIN